MLEKGGLDYFVKGKVVFFFVEQKKKTCRTEKNSKPKEGCSSLKFSVISFLKCEEMPGFVL